MFLKDYTPWKGPGEKPFTKHYILWEPYAGARKEYKDDGAAGMKHYELNTTPILLLPVMLRDRRWKRVTGGRWFWFVYLLDALILSRAFKE